MKSINLSRVVTIVSLSLSVLFTACKEDEKTVNEVKPSKAMTSFIATEAVGYVVDEKSYEVDPKEEQIVSTSRRDLYSVSNCDYSKHYTLEIDGDLELNKSVDVICKAEGYDKIVAGELKMKVVKVDDDEGKVWIWNSKEEEGFVLKFY